MSNAMISVITTTRYSKYRSLRISTPDRCYTLWRADLLYGDMWNANNVAVGVIDTWRRHHDVIGDRPHI